MWAATDVVEAQNILGTVVLLERRNAENVDVKDTGL